VQIYWFDELSSTQSYLKEKLGSKELVSPVAIAAHRQTQGVGSRGNTWIGMEGNLFFSFALSRDALPSDLPLESSSIYFSYLLKELFSEAGSELWLKWPNDFYLNGAKIGGTITFLKGNDLLCGIGINLLKSPEGFACLDIAIDKKELLNEFFKKIKNKPSWKHIFSKYEVEFSRSKNHSIHYENNKISLENAELNADGSLNIDGQRIYSLR
jgi:BirA family biotin operon repressor/biotin-[acetyl-CoA-carboxylase] ligase